MRIVSQMELGRNRVRAKRIDVWQQAVDTEVFNPRFRSDAMRARMSSGVQDPVILAYVGRLGAGTPARLTGTRMRCLLHSVGLGAVPASGCRAQLLRQRLHTATAGLRHIAARRVNAGACGPSLEHAAQHGAGAGR